MHNPHFTKLHQVQLKTERLVTPNIQIHNPHFPKLHQVRLKTERLVTPNT
jgi:hypothetical protein